MEGKRPLWAPWRVEYIRNLGSPGCFLCGNTEKNPEKPDVPVGWAVVPVYVPL